MALDPWQRDVLLSAAPRLLLNATRQSGKSTAAGLKAAWTVLQGGLAVVVSPSLRQSGFLRMGTRSEELAHRLRLDSQHVAPGLLTFIKQPRAAIHLVEGDTDLT